MSNTEETKERRITPAWQQQTDRLPMPDAFEAGEARERLERAATRYGGKVARALIAELSQVARSKNQPEAAAVAQQVILTAETAYLNEKGKTNA